MVLVPRLAPPQGVRANARFVVNPRSQSARIEVTRRIEAGGEIFLAYGADYWRHAHSTTHSTSVVPDWEWDLSNPFSSITSAPTSSLPHSLSFSSLPVVLSPPRFLPSSVDPVPVPPSLFYRIPAPVSAVDSTPDRPRVPVPAVGSSRDDDDWPPPLSTCEVHVGLPALACLECIPGLVVCPSHLSPCGGVSLLCCTFCLKVLCLKHMYCPCSEAIERRRQVALFRRLSFRLSFPPSRSTANGGNIIVLDEEKTDKEETIVHEMEEPVPVLGSPASSSSSFFGPQFIAPTIASSSNLASMAPLSVSAPLQEVVEIKVPAAVGPSLPVSARCRCPGPVCVSPGPTYNGSPIDRVSLPWPLTEQLDWPINDSWRDFAFAPVCFPVLTVDIEPFPTLDIAL